MKYRKKPVVIEAVKYIGNGNVENHDVPDWMWDALRAGTITHTANSNFQLGKLDDAGVMQIKTLEGVMTVSPGDFIIRGVKGEIYSCKPDIFDATYEPAPDAE